MNMNMMKVLIDFNANVNKGSCYNHGRCNMMMNNEILFLNFQFKKSSDNLACDCVYELDIFYTMDLNLLGSTL